MSEVKVSRRGGTGKFYVDLRSLGGKRVSLKTTDARVARARAQESGALLGGATLSAAHKRVMAERWGNDKAPPEKHYRKVLELLGDVRMTELDRNMLGRLVVLSKEQGVGPATINRRLAYLSVLLRDALSRGEIPGLPLLPKQKEPEGRTLVLEREHEDAIIAWFRQQRLPDLARLTEVAVDTGLRLGELLRLRSGDIQDGVLIVRVAKGRRPRSVPLTARALQACQEGFWEAWTTHRVEHYWKRMRAALERPETFHTLRHTCATRLIRSGMDIRLVQIWMGHSTISTTARYAHVNVEDLKQLRDALQ